MRRLVSGPVVVAAQCQFTCQIYGFSPEEHSITGWEVRVSEALFSAIKLYIEDHKCLPPAHDYVEMARHAIESPVR